MNHPQGKFHKTERNGNYSAGDKMTLQQCHQVETKIGVPCVSMHNATD